MPAEYFDASARRQLGAGFFQKIAHALDNIDRAWAAGRTCNRLANMSDAQLASYGIKREDIPQIVIQQLLGRNSTQSGH